MPGRLAHGSWTENNLLEPTSELNHPHEHQEHQQSVNEIGFEHATDHAIVGLDAVGCITSWNSGAQKLYGYLPSETIGRHFSRLDAADGEHDPSPQALLNMALVRGRAAVQHWQARKDCSRFYGVGSIVRCSKGGVRGFVRIVQDLTHYERARERAQKEAAEALAAKDRFLGMLAHELRTPLEAIRLWIKLLRDGIAKPELFAKAIKVLEETAAAQSHLIDDLLDAARSNSGFLKLKLHRMAIRPLVKSCVEAIRPLFDETKIDLEFQAPREPMVAELDAARMQQVLWNVLRNAIKFTLPGGRVVVKLGRCDNRAHVSITDTGRGIDAKLLPQIFDRFTRGDDAANEPGLGIGLWIARQIVELHGGTISAESAGTGKGAAFHIHLKVA
jgi:PAS domain S-box-containing protein